MTRTLLILGLVLLAALLPLAAVLLTLDVFVVDLPAIVHAEARPAAGVQPVALLALTPFRAPPPAR